MEQFIKFTEPFLATLLISGLPGEEPKKPGERRSYIDSIPCSACEETFSAENIQVEEIEIHEKPEVPGLDVLTNEEGIPEDGSENTAEIEQDADIITKDPIKIVDDELKNLESELVYEEGNEIDIPSLTITNIEEKEMKKEEGENIEFVEQEEAEKPKILKEINESPLEGDRSLDMKTGG